MLRMIWAQMHTSATLHAENNRWQDGSQAAIKIKDLQKNDYPILILTANSQLA